MNLLLMSRVDLLLDLSMLVSICVYCYLNEFRFVLPVLVYLFNVLHFVGIYIAFCLIVFCNPYFVVDLYVVEFLKRGLPHIHALIWLKEQTRDATGIMVDKFISAEIPDVRIDPLGYAVVEEFMVHGPCGEFNINCPCMKDGACSKRYPKTFNDETFVDSLGFPVYRRRQDDRYIMKNGVKLDNTWVVPHNL
jgi:hypothetical protein